MASDSGLQHLTLSVPHHLPTSDICLFVCLGQTLPTIYANAQGAATIFDCSTLL